VPDSRRGLLLCGPCGWATDDNDRPGAAVEPPLPATDGRRVRRSGSRGASVVSHVLSRTEAHQSSRAETIDEPPREESENRPDDQLAERVSGCHLRARPAELGHHEVVVQRQAVQGQADNGEQRQEGGRGNLGLMGASSVNHGSQGTSTADGIMNSGPGDGNRSRFAPGCCLPRKRSSANNARGGSPIERGECHESQSS